MIDTLILTVMVGLVVSFLVAFATKSGLRNRLIEHCEYDKIAEMLQCDFCLCWWSCLVASIIVASLFGTVWTILIAIPATPIAKYLL